VSINHHNGHRQASVESLRSPHERLVLWHLRGALDDLACVVSPTSYGYTLGLELAGESILVELQPSVDRLTDKAARIEQWLLTQGWTPAGSDGQ
jgi:hypothetical protein